LNTCLVICRNPSGLSALTRFRSQYSVIVASDDPRVQEAARKLTWVTDVTYIEKKEAFWAVAQDVKAMLGQVNEWLSSLDPSLPKEALSWGTHVEGGKTAQRIQDVFLLIRSYYHLFSEFNVCEVHIIRGSSSLWEDQVLVACAEAKTIPSWQHGSNIFATWKDRLTRTVFPFSKAGYLLFHEVLLGAGRPFRASEKVDLNGVILFQLNSSLQKHVDNIKEIMLALLDRGEHPVGLCWSAAGPIKRLTGLEQLTAKGITTVGLERFVSLRDMLVSLWLAAIIFLRARRRLTLLRSLQYEGVQLAPLLDESIRYFIIVVLPSRLRYAQALSVCLSDSRPVAIKPWGGGDFFEGKLALRLLHNNGKDPIYIHYWVGAGHADWPYTDLTYRPDIFLAKSEFEAELAALEYKLNESQIEVVGQARFAHLSSFAMHYSDEMSRRQLNLPLDGSLYVGVDPGGSIRGYQTYREQIELLISVLSATRNAPGLVLVIKPHPSSGIEHLIPLITPYKCENVVVLSKMASVEHFLNSVDILVTKFSTLILEAALLGRCSISTVFSGEHRFNILGDLPAFVRSGVELEDLLVRLTSDSKNRELWKKDRLSRNKELLPRFYYNGSGNPDAFAADAIIKALQSEDFISDERINDDKFSK